MHFITSKLTAAQNGLRDIVRFIRDWLVVWNTAVEAQTCQFSAAALTDWAGCFTCFVPCLGLTPWTLVWLTMDLRSTLFVEWWFLIIHMKLTS